ncbi:ribosome assembly cofactor RimP [Flavobacterium sp. DG1-102-2]|uniref:ribosome assembly cofactor RimP n=1 Tax=Flavobacterium sp. DG1-102-2 TaxID=3081663 RepID=UPI002949DA8E|nr:ribosome assembly cofactor RimP [Flavobacterium sp. DG1-102-2]MDV6170308.1 ribosome assembly cofactor RimP [Flavobacterium sp. DG1-102-2]
MTFKEKVADLLNKGLEEHPELFLVELSITGANKIMVTLDGDKGVTLQDCINISRAIEHNLDREEDDFSLEVASGGAASPLKLPRQYKKNIGRTLSVKTATEQIEAKITDANEDFVVLEWEAREPKKIGKGKETVQKRLELPYQDIKEAVVVIKF